MTGEHTLEITKDGEPFKVFMSFGLLNQLTKLLGEIDQLPMLAIDPGVQERVLIEIFTERDTKGSPTSVPNLYEIRVSLEDIDAILDFAGDHIANFFMAAAEKAQKRVLELHAKLEKSQAKLSGLTLTKNGFSPSP